jgi:hypothetical protein
MRKLIALAVAASAAASLAAPALSQAAQPGTTGAQTLTFGACSAKFVQTGNGNILENNRTGDNCPYQTYRIVFVPNSGQCPDSPDFSSPYNAYASGDTNLEPLFGTGTYTACFYQKD